MVTLNYISYGQKMVANGKKKLVYKQRNNYKTSNLNTGIWAERIPEKHLHPYQGGEQFGEAQGHISRVIAVLEIDWIVHELNC